MLKQKAEKKTKKQNNKELKTAQKTKDLQTRIPLKQMVNAAASEG